MMMIYMKANMNENQSEDKEVSSLKDITRSNLGVTVT
jgi:hypothetical protein